METIWKGKQTNKQTSGGSTCRGTDAEGGAELHSMWSPVHNASEYTEELQRCIRDALEKHGGLIGPSTCPFLSYFAFV